TPIPPCPWVSGTDFIKNFNSPQMTQLRKFLLDTVAGQTQFLVVRAQSAIDKILDSTPESNEREHITTQFTRIVQASKDLYPLIDYVNFKGEGVDPAETALDKETGERQGWGLKQVLLKMNGTANELCSRNSPTQRNLYCCKGYAISPPTVSGRQAGYSRPIVDLSVIRN